VKIPVFQGDSPVRSIYKLKIPFDIMEDFENLTIEFQISQVQIKFSRNTSPFISFFNPIDMAQKEITSFLRRLSGSRPVTATAVKNKKSTNS
jgi:hypothetical protein